MLGSTWGAAAHRLRPFQQEPLSPLGVQRRMAWPLASRLSSPIVLGQPVHITAQQVWGGSRCDPSRTVVRGPGQAPRETLARGGGGGTFLSLCQFVWAERSAVAQARWGRVEMGLFAQVRESFPVGWGGDRVREQG